MTNVEHLLSKPYRFPVFDMCRAAMQSRSHRTNYSKSWKSNHSNHWPGHILSDMDVLNVYVNMFRTTANIKITMSAHVLFASILSLLYTLSLLIVEMIINCNKANLRDLIAATGLVILLKLDSNRNFSAHVTLKFDGWPWKIIGHLFYTTSSFVHHVKSIGGFQQKLQSGNAQFRSKSAIIGPMWPWNLMDDLEKQ